MGLIGWKKKKKNCSRVPGGANRVSATRFNNWFVQSGAEKHTRCAYYRSVMEVNLNPVMRRVEISFYRAQTSLCLHDSQE